MEAHVRITPAAVLLGRHRRGPWPGPLRPGNAGSNTTADHITVLDCALEQIPDAHRQGPPILIRSDSAGCTHGLFAHIRSLRGHGVDGRFSVGVAVTEGFWQAILAVRDWTQPSTPTANPTTEPRSVRSPA
jgi:hypothetical protein